MPGASERSSRVSAPAYRSPDASPHESSSRRTPDADRPPAGGGDQRGDGVAAQARPQLLDHGVRDVLDATRIARPGARAIEAAYHRSGIGLHLDAHVVRVLELGGDLHRAALLVRTDALF